MSRITFVRNKEVGCSAYPYPATRNLPEWYRKMPTQFMQERGPVRSGHGSMRKCVPVWDALTAGYIIPTFTDIHVSIRNGGQWFEWASADAVDMHPADQAPDYPGMNTEYVGKFMQPWGIKTAPGYSCLIVPPLHRPNGIFTCLPGIVDTDRYHSPVNVPFLFAEPDWTGLIPVGTPMMQVIPFRREAWEHKIIEDDGSARATVAELSARFRNRYRSSFWNRKSYK